MMRWTPTDVDGVREGIGSARTDAADARTSPAGDPTALRYLLDAVVAGVSALGARSVVVALVVALVVAAVVFGLSADEAAAAVRWCPKC